MALAAIFQVVSEDTLLLLAEKETTKVAWETLKTMYVDAERIKRAKVQTLISEFELLLMKKTESIDDFAMKLTTNVNRIRGLGNKMDESTIIKKFLRAVPPKFLRIVSTIEQFGDMKMMTMKSSAV